MRSHANSRGILAEQGHPSNALISGFFLPLSRTHDPTSNTYPVTVHSLRPAAEVPSNCQLRAIICSFSRSMHQTTPDRIPPFSTPPSVRRGLRRDDGHGHIRCVSSIDQSDLSLQRTNATTPWVPAEAPKPLIWRIAAGPVERWRNRAATSDGPAMRQCLPEDGTGWSCRWIDVASDSGGK